MATASSECVTQVTKNGAMSGWEVICTPGHELQCATAKSKVCHCACGGERHGKERALYIETLHDGLGLGAARRRVRERLSQQLPLLDHTVPGLR